MEKSGINPKTVILMAATRVKFASWLAAQGIKTGAEIGVAAGEYSLPLCNALEGPIYLVDPWKTYPKSIYNDMANVVQVEHDMRFRYVNSFIKARGLNAKTMRMTSAEAAEEFEPASLDFVYIDANHGYEFVIIDLEAWWDKVRPGGFVCGHDFSSDTVNSALADFIGIKGDWRTLLIITEERDIQLSKDEGILTMRENQTEEYQKKYEHMPPMPMSFAIEKT